MDFQKFIGLLVFAAPVLLYIGFQIRALIKFRGGRRIFAAVPLLFMIPVYVFTIQLLLQGSNLWPIYLFLGSPVAFVWLLIAFKFERA
jgi:uncharacterized protein YebE (UPF0316 family)